MCWIVTHSTWVPTTVGVQCSRASNLLQNIQQTAHWISFFLVLKDLSSHTTYSAPQQALPVQNLCSHTSPHNLAKHFNVHEISAFCCDMFPTAQHAESSSCRIVPSGTYRYPVVRIVRGHTWNTRESFKLIVSASYRHRIVRGVGS